MKCMFTGTKGITRFSNLTFPHSMVSLYQSIFLRTHVSIESLYMKKLTGMVSLVVLLVLMIPHPISAASKQSKPTSGSLIGTWQCTGHFGNAPLVFESQNHMVFNGDPASYHLVPGAIRVQEDYGSVDYAYILRGNNLSVTFPDGAQMECVKVSGGGRKADDAGEKSRGGAAGNGSNGQLMGMLCSWSGSSTSGSGYSRTTRVAFDGQGRFRYGSESSFSSDSGQAYGKGGVNHGTYRVSGSKVYLTFSDGSTVAAQVHMKQNNGMITELMFNGTLYAKGLCD